MIGTEIPFWSLAASLSNFPTFSPAYFLKHGSATQNCLPILLPVHDERAWARI